MIGTENYVEDKPCLVHANEVSSTKLKVSEKNEIQVKTILKFTLHFLDGDQFAVQSFLAQ